MSMTDTQLREAVGKVVEYLAPLVSDYSRMYSVRGVLVLLKYEPEQIEEIIPYIAARGFGYCMDQSVPHDGVFPSWGACQWNPDQLHSRVRFVA